MAKVRFIGDKRQTFSWVSMGKAKSFSVSPGHTINVSDSDMAYLLSFGKFEAIINEEDTAENGVVVKTFEREKVTPIIKEIRVSSNVKVEEPASAPADVPVVEEAPATPVAEADPIVLEEKPGEAPQRDDEYKKVVKVDYTSKRKAELKKLCKERGLDDKGNRDNLIARLVVDDEK